jgi:threonine dehydratase
MSAVDKPITFQDVKEARQRIAKQIHVTPVLTCETFNKSTERELFFKCENLQKVRFQYF